MHVTPTTALAVVETNGYIVQGKVMNEHGHRVFEFYTPQHSRTGSGSLVVSEAGYKLGRVALANIGPSVTLPDVALERVTPALALTIEGRYFKLNGQPHTLIGCSDFNLLARYIKEGEAVVREVLQDRKHYGFNTLRVWTRFGGDEVPESNRERFEREIGRLQPSEHPELYDKLRPFALLCAEYGMCVEFTAYCGGSRGDHWERLGAGLQGLTNVIVDGMNETDGYAHDVDVSTFTDIPGIPCTRGQHVHRHVPPRPWMQYETMHTNESSEWWRKGGHNGMELTEGDAEGHIVPSGVPMYINENERPDKDGNLGHHEDAARAAALLVAGSCFHSISGKNSQVFTEEDRPFAEAFVKGAKSVPIGYQGGIYTAGHLHSGEPACPIEHRDAWSLRTFGRIHGGRACIAVIEKKPGWELNTRGGWRVVREDEELIELER